MKKLLLSSLLIGLFLTGCTVAPIITNNVNNSDNPPTTISYKVDLSHKQLKTIDQDIFNQIKATELDVSFNQLTGSLPAEIRKLQNLKILYASNNQMSGVPAEIGQLTKLEILDLSNNLLTGLPNELGNLVNLKTLNISGNRYSVQDLKTITDKLPATVNVIK